MKNKIKKVRRKTVLYMQQDERLGKKVFVHDMKSPRMAQFYGQGLPLFKVRVIENIEASNPGKPYWAWWNNKEERFCYVWPFKLAVDMCFSYGAKAEEERGRGHLLPVIIEEIEEVTDAT